MPTLLAIVVAWVLCGIVSAWNSRTPFLEMMREWHNGRAKPKDVAVAILAFALIFLAARWLLNQFI